jgi:hypothetical protein
MALDVCINLVKTYTLVVMFVSVCHFLFYYSVLFLFVSLHVCQLSYFSSSRLSNPLFLDISILLDSYHVHILLQVIQKVGSQVVWKSRELISSQVQHFRYIVTFGSHTFCSCETSSCTCDILFYN